MKFRIENILFLSIGYMLGANSGSRSIAPLKSVNGRVESPSIVAGKPSNKSLSIKNHFFEELPRITFLTVFWGILALMLILLIYSNAIDQKTPVPDGAVHYVDEMLNLWVGAFDISIFIFVTGIAAIFGNESFVRMTQEEICRFFYNLSAFMGWLSVAISYFYYHFDIKKITYLNYAFAILLFAEGMFVGLVISWLFKYKSRKLVKS